MKTTLSLILAAMVFFTGAAALSADELIQTAILLDTSSSMDGLIAQAKTQLWKIVNELALAKRNGKSPALEVAVYEYGNSGLKSADGYIRLVLPLTRDLDKVSESLFALRTNGGDEYCGQVIDRATRELAWNRAADVLKLVFIAGNEEFTQGPVDYRASCKAAVAQGIIVNTIYCGDNAEGARTFWLAGSQLADGQYFSIDQNAAVAYVKAPQDDEILRLNAALNQTYLPYGREGESGRTLQTAQDSNAAASGAGSNVDRTIAKSKAQYSNERWDLVDAAAAGRVNPADLKEEDLPAELKGKSAAERRVAIAARAKERSEIQNKIAALEKNRRLFIESEQKKAGAGDTLDTAVITGIRDQAAKKRYQFKD